MATSIGAYATLAGVKARLDPSMGASQDANITASVNQVNDWVESRTGRVLAPVPAFSTTLNGSVALGATTATLTTVAGLAVGDDIMFGLVTATPHEHATVMAINGNVVTLMTALASGYANATAVKRVLVLDGFDALEGGRLMPYDRGIVSIASCEIALYTGGPFATVPLSDIKLRPAPPDPGWSFTEIWMSNVPVASNTTPYFAPGYDNVRLDCITGWPAIPDGITEVALNLAIAMWRGRASGGGDNFTIGVDGERSFERMLSYLDRQTIERYRVKSVEII
jgi:hypothetical protein